jgi:hypothetical protein
MFNETFINFIIQVLKQTGNRVILFLFLVKKLTIWFVSERICILSNDEIPSKGSILVINKVFLELNGCESWVSIINFASDHWTLGYSYYNVF